MLRLLPRSFKTTAAEPVPRFIRAIGFNLLALLSVTLLTGCSDSDESAGMVAVELEGIVVTSAAPVILGNLKQQRIHLFFFAPECESCWQTMVRAEPLREAFNLAGVVMSEDNFAVYEQARSHFIFLLPIYADHDGNIAYDYDVEIEQAPLWITIDSGRVVRRAESPPEELVGRL